MPPASKPGASFLRSGGMALLFVSLAIGPELLLTRLFPYPFLFLFFGAVVASAWFGGMMAGLFAVVFSILAVDYFFIPPGVGFVVNAAAGTYLAAFVVCAMVASWVSSSKKKSEEALKETRDQLEVRVSERTAALMKTQAELTHLSRVLSMGELTASIAHEIKQPLTAVVAHGDACLEWLSADPPNLDKARHTAERIIQEGTRAGAVLSRIRALFKKDNPSKDWVDINELIQDLMALLRDEAVEAENLCPNRPCARFAEGRSGSCSNATSGAQSGDQWHGRHRRRKQLREKSAHRVPEGVRKRNLGADRRYGSGSDGGKRGEDLRHLFHHESAGHRNGPFHQPLDRGIPRRPLVGDAASGGWYYFSIHGARALSRALMDSPASVVFVVDDDASVREALSNLLQSVGFCAEVFGSTEEFLKANRPAVPSCLVLDVTLPGMNGLEFQEMLSKTGNPIPIVFITAFGDIPMTSNAMKAGAVEFLAKPFQKDDLLTAIDQALARDSAQRAVEASISALRARQDELTPREREVMDLVVTGMINKQIADRLGISEVTVKIHRRQVMLKMEAPSLADLVRMSDRLRIPQNR